MPSSEVTALREPQGGRGASQLQNTGNGPVMLQMINKIEQFMVTNTCTEKQKVAAPEKGPLPAA